MKPILPGSRGPAVEDIQRRLLKLGYDLGPTGVDGVFHGLTRDAVLEFQSRCALREDGVVGHATWSALVDATFTFGDRMLYLRLPHLHGHDVRVLQRALSTLGFACGDPDGIFGPYTERAVREFQRNSGQSADGIVGAETVGAIVGLRHVWEGKDAAVPFGRSALMARTTDALARVATAVLCEGAGPCAIGERFANVAAATDDRVSIRVLARGDADASGFDLKLVLVEAPESAPISTPVVQLGDDPETALAARLITALAAAPEGEGRTVAIAIGQVGDDEQELQRAAVRVLDGVCLALA